MNGELDFAHVLYGLVYGVHLGIGGPRKDMAVLMGLNQNGQAITLSNKLLQAGARDGESLARLMASDKREYTFAQTFPTGTHAMWLYYWLAAHGIDPMRDAKAITVPPPQMVANMRVGNMDGFCVGEPWARARSWTRSASPPSRRRASGPTIPKGAGRQRRVRGAPSQHGAGRHGCGAGGGQVDRRFRGQPPEDRRDHRRQVLRQYRRGRHRRPHAGAATRTAWASPGAIRMPCAFMPMARPTSPTLATACGS